MYLVRGVRCREAMWVLLLTLLSVARYLLLMTTFLHWGLTAANKLHQLCQHIARSAEIGLSLLTSHFQAPEEKELSL